MATRRRRPPERPAVIWILALIVAVEALLRMAEAILDDRMDKAFLWMVGGVVLVGLVTWGENLKLREKR
ncbi:MAG: hypothetical protein HYT80_10470 [Euryarchaeota archaeon]|nr:hypothetical protein [Euryarchaeota archaeon]